MSKVVELDDHRPHRVQCEECTACGHRWVAVMPMDCPEDGTECPKCHAMASKPITEEEFRRPPATVVDLATRRGRRP